MKKLVAIILTIILCYNTAGYYIVFKARQIQIKSEIKKLIKSSVPEAQLTVFSLTTANRQEFKWIHSKEFRYRGEMYDVVRKVAVSADKTELFCIHDAKESGLFSNLDKQVREATSQERNGTNAIKVLSTFFTGLFPPPELVNNFIPESVEFNYPVVPDLYSFLSDTVISPPPRS